MNILFLTKYDRMGASSRYRSLQYFQILEEHGIACTCSPLFMGKYLESVYKTGHRSVTGYLRSFLRRLIGLFRISRYDLVVVEYELFPFLPPLFEHIINLFGKNYVVDYDDAVFHRYDLHCSPLVRALLGNKIARVMRGASAVIVGNSYLEQYAAQSGARTIHRLPTVIDLRKYKVSTTSEANDVFTVGWIGSPSTTPYFEDVVREIPESMLTSGVQFVAMGASPLTESRAGVEIVPWEESREVEFLCSCDVGIMPLPDTPWARGKCGFKLIQYMGCGLPVVASPVGVNCEIVEHGVNGFLATTPEEWQSTLETLRRDPALRARMGAAGRKLVEERYSLQAVAGRFVDIIKESAGK